MCLSSNTQYVYVNLALSFVQQNRCVLNCGGFILELVLGAMCISSNKKHSVETYLYFAY